MRYFWGDITITADAVVLITKVTAAQNELSLNYHRVRGLYFLSVIFAAII